MKIGMHQPYLFPYRGYFDLIASVDKFVVYDDAKYIKNGWINKNYYPLRFTFQLEKHSDYAKINECYFKDLKGDKTTFKNVTKLNAEKYLNLLQPTYNLSYNITLTLQAICKDLGITTPFYMASDIPHGKFVQGILDIVHALGGDTYVNLPGGKKLYTQDMFGDIKLEFIDTKVGSSILCEI
jgi:hypothetical protein